MQAELDKILYFSDIEKQKRQNIHAYYDRHGAAIARELAQKELEDMEYQATGEENTIELPEVPQAFSGNGKSKQSPKGSAGKGPIRRLFSGRSRRPRSQK